MDHKTYIDDILMYQTKKVFSVMVKFTTILRENSISIFKENIVAWEKKKLKVYHEYQLVGYEIVKDVIDSNAWTYFEWSQSDDTNGAYMYS